MSQILDNVLEGYRNSAKAKWEMILTLRVQLKKMEKRVKYYKNVRNILNKQNVSTQLADTSIQNAKETISNFLERIVNMKKSRKNDFEMIKHLENAKFIEESEIQ